MWDAVKTETRGRVQVEIFPENNHFKDGDPDPLDLLVRGRTRIPHSGGQRSGWTSAGGQRAGDAVRFRTHSQVYRRSMATLAITSARSCEAKGVYAFPTRLL